MLIGLDIGGTKMMVAAGDSHTGEIIAKTQGATPQSLEKGLLKLHRMIAEVSQMAGQGAHQAFGAAVGGPLNFRTGVVSPLHQPEWREVDLKRIIGRRYNAPFAVEVDTDAAALGEYTSIPQRDRPGRLLYITLSTGMGGGLIFQGKIYRGLNWAHPEIAHQGIPARLELGRPAPCECGVSDCLEGLISGNGIKRVYGKPAEALLPEEWDEVAWNLGQGLRNLATILSPDEIVLGGGVAVGGGQPFIDRAAEVMREHLRLVPAPAVRLSRHGYDTALVGALVLAQGVMRSFEG